ncbi:telomerase-binding protein EST1A [Lucilia cuprina]|uniref:telomerase-binding protein EST1A n=1 Tax=Lucilia cuprina TaxID=7375 RepID=UPI001F0515E5|nr:telomerase-binding protein EST1A [Lucilia cuprina]
MNRKGTREQNDISIIIGNLPKRLQEKIITREGNNNSSINGGSGINNATSGGSTDNVFIGSVSRRQEEVGKPAICKPPECITETSNSNGNEVTSIDYFLRMSAKSRNVEEKVEIVRPVLEASGSITHPIMPAEKQTNIAIPGLIRLNAEDAKKLNECSQDSRNGLRNHDRRNRHQTRQELLSSRYELPMSPVRQVQKLNHPLWFNALVDDANAKRLPQLFECLQNTMSHNLVIENWSNLHTIRQELQDIFKNLLLNNLKFCCEQKVDSFFWKILFYNMREHLKQQQNVSNAINYIQMIITEGIEFYEDIYQQILEKYLTKDPKQQISIKNQQRSQHKLDLMARVTAQKLLIYLGDLWRYKIKDLQGQNYEEAAKYYKQAQALVPSNGVPYNQLAIVAIHNRKKLDAIYYHMRSLMSSNAIPSAKESLLVLFDEIRKKYEETELKSSPLHYNYNNNHQSSKSMRKEVWIYPDGVRRLHRTDLNGNNNYKMIINEEKRFREMTAEELLRRITSLYLYIIGKLFTGVGMETILEHQRKLLLQLSVLLEYEPLAITRNRLMKILALNIFAIEHNLDKDTRRYHAFNFCNQVFGLILRKSHELLHTLNTNPEEFQDEHFLDLNTTLQYNRIYALWLKHHINIWEPIKNEDHIFINSWLELEKLFNILQQENLLNVTHPNNIIYEEDIFFKGFTPLASIIPKTNRDSSSDESLQLKGRLKVLLDFQTTYDENRKCLENLTTSHFINEDLNSDIKQALDDLQSEQSTKSEDGDDENDDSDECNEDNVTETIVANDDIEKSLKTNTLKLCLTTKQEDNQLSHLSKLKRELEAKTHVKKMYHNKLEEILKFVDTKVYIEVRPKYLLPDTNCFIDCLEDFERIVNEFKRYTLVIPLTVVKELDGLSKGVKVDSYEESLQKQRIHHYDDVSTRAKKSLDFIKTAKSHVKCATTKGSIINASLFALVEEEHVSNDDKILATAIALSKTMSSETSKDGKCFIQTELVLITTDRNLRVKALSRNLAVSELPEFLQWAKDCN